MNHVKLCGWLLLGMLSFGWDFCLADDLSAVFATVYERTVGAENEPVNQPKEPEVHSEIAVLAKGAIHFYQEFISSQDKPTCVFQPSCSQFGAACLARFHPVKAFFLTADRLQRCHGGAFGHYPFDLTTHRLSDPVEVYD